MNARRGRNERRGFAHYDSITTVLTNKSTQFVRITIIFCTSNATRLGPHWHFTVEGTVALKIT